MMDNSHNRQLEYVEQVELITVLETLSVVLQGVCTVAFISVPSLFYIAAHEASPNEDYEAVEEKVTTFLIFVDAFLMFLLLAQIGVLQQLKAGFNELDPTKLRPWLVFNLIFYFLGAGGAIYCIIVQTSTYGLHIANYLFLIYRGWTLIEVLLFHRELESREPIISKLELRRQQKAGYAETDEVYL